MTNDNFIPPEPQRPAQQEVAPPMTMETALAINHSLLRLYLISIQKLEPTDFFVHKHALKNNSLGELVLATAMVDNDNMLNKRQAELMGKPFDKFPQTLADRYIAAIFAFIQFEIGDIPVFDGKNALILAEVPAQTSPSLITMVQ